MTLQDWHMAVQIVVQIAMQWHNCLSLSHSFVHIPTAHTHTHRYTVSSLQRQQDIWPRDWAMPGPGPTQCMLGYRPWWGTRPVKESVSVCVRVRVCNMFFVFCVNQVRRGGAWRQNHGESFIYYYLSVCLSVRPSVCPSVCLSVHLFECQSENLFECQSDYWYAFISWMPCAQLWMSCWRWKQLLLVVRWQYCRLLLRYWDVVQS